MKKIYLLLLCLMCSHLDAFSFTHTEYSAVADTIKEENIEIQQGDRKAKRNSAANTALQRKAQRLYEKWGYLAAADLYSKLADEGELSDDIMAELAESYRLNGETIDAEYWYSKFMKDATDPQQLIGYALV